MKTRLMFLVFLFCLNAQAITTLVPHPLVGTKDRGYIVVDSDTGKYGLVPETFEVIGNVNQMRFETSPWTLCFYGDIPRKFCIIFETSTDAKMFRQSLLEEKNPYEIVLRYYNEFTTEHDIIAQAVILIYQDTQEQISIYDYMQNYMKSKRLCGLFELWCPGFWRFNRL